MMKVRIILLGGLLALAALAGCRSAHTTSAILYIDEQKYDKAVQVIHEGFQFADNEPDAYFFLAEAYSHLAEEAVERDDYPEAKKNYELAYEAYQKTLDLDRAKWEEEVNDSLKYNYNNRYRQAGLDWNDEYFEQAEGHLRLAFAALPDSLTPIKNIARMKMQMANMDAYQDKREVLMGEALDLLDTVLEAHPEAYDLQANKANVLTALGRNEEAGAIYDKLLREHGDDTSLLLDIVQLAVNDGDYAKAADFYVKVVDLNLADTDAGNDEDNKEMLVRAGTWYAMANIGRYDDAIAVLDRAANLEMIPTQETMLQRLRTYYNYARHVRQQAADATDPVEKAELETKGKALLDRSVELGVAMTNNFPQVAEGFLYLSMAQIDLGDFAAAELNNKTYEELSGGGQ
ncbi:MAG: tetratricopeptide repeat protein [Candidatus Krumholzibacteriia bacterium]